MHRQRLALIVLSKVRANLMELWHFRNVCENSQELSPYVEALFLAMGPYLKANLDLLLAELN